MIACMAKANQRLQRGRSRNTEFAHRRFGPDAIDESLQAFEASLRLRSTPDHTARTMRRVRAFLQACEARPDVADWQEHVTAYLAQGMASGWSPKTAHNHAGSLSAWFDHIGIEPNPCTCIRLPKPEKRLARYLTFDEIEQAMKIARETGIENEVQLALTTGLRLSEMIRLKWADVKLGEKMLIVRKSKSHRQRAVPLCPSALEAFARQQAVSENLIYVFPGRQTFRGGEKLLPKPRKIQWWGRAIKPVQEAVAAFLVDVGARSTGRGWHMLRHTFASVAAQRGVSLYKIAQWLGHTDTRTTAIYAHLAQGYDDDIELADPLRQPPRKREDLDSDIARAIISDLQSVIEQAGLEDRIPAGTRALLNRL